MAEASPTLFLNIPVLYIFIGSGILIVILCSVICVLSVSLINARKMIRTNKTETKRESPNREGRHRQRQDPAQPTVPVCNDAVGQSTSYVNVDDLKTSGTHVYSEAYEPRQSEMYEMPFDNQGVEVNGLDVYEVHEFPMQ